MTARYEQLEVVGRGGFGEVVRARLHTDAGFTREVALKVLPDKLDAEAVERLRHEASCLAAVQHRAVVHVDRVEHIDGRWALVMEYVPGADLSHLLKLGPVPARAAFQICEEVAGALHAASEAGVRHRDLKPANLRVTPLGAVKVLDFGLALVAGTDEAGSTGFRAPERLRGEEGPADDVYALGCVLYELLAGRPFGQTTSRRSGHERRVRAALEGLDAADLQCALLSELLAFEPGARPVARAVEARSAQLAGPGMSLRDWAEQAVGFLEGEPVPSLPSEVGFTAPASEPPARPRRWGAAALLLVAVAVVAVAAPSLLSRPAAPEPSATVAPEPIAPAASPVPAPLPAEPEPSPPRKVPIVAPAAAPPPEPAAAPVAAVRYEGATALWLVRDGHRVDLPAEVPEGTWDIWASFRDTPHRHGSVRVAAGEEVVLTCDALQRCSR